MATIHGAIMFNKTAIIELHATLHERLDLLLCHVITEMAPQFRGAVRHPIQGFRA